MKIGLPYTATFVFFLLPAAGAQASAIHYQVDYVTASTCNFVAGFCVPQPSINFTGSFDLDSAALSVPGSYDVEPTFVSDLIVPSPGLAPTEIIRAIVMAGAVTDLTVSYGWIQTLSAVDPLFQVTNIYNMAASNGSWSTGQATAVIGGPGNTSTTRHGFYTFQNFTELTPAPEPASAALLIAAGVLLAVMKRPSSR